MGVYNNCRRDLESSLNLRLMYLGRYRYVDVLLHLPPWAIQGVGYYGEQTTSK